MDGFAVRAGDTPGTLQVAFRIAAGALPPSSLPGGAGRRHRHGRAVPEGADAVVPVEVGSKRTGRSSSRERARPALTSGLVEGTSSGDVVVATGDAPDRPTYRRSRRGGVAEVECSRVPA